MSALDNYSTFFEVSGLKVRNGFQAARFNSGEPAVPTASVSCERYAVKIVSQSISLPQANEFFKKWVAAGGTTQDVQDVIESPNNMAAKRLLAFMRGTDSYEETASQQKARSIMGRNFIGAGMVVRHFGVQFPHLAWEIENVLFSDEVLEACKDTHVLFPGYPLTLLDVRDRVNTKLFYRGEVAATKDDDWFNGEKFASQEKVDMRWYLVRREPVPESTSKNWQEQTALLTEGEVVPRACEVVYMTVLTYLVTDERLFENNSVRCSDAASDGDRVHVGWFFPSGLSVASSPDSYRGHSEGMAAARNP